MNETTQTAAAVALIGAAMATVGLVRGPLAAATLEVKAKDDTYALPPPEQLPIVCLGYRSAFADVLWATTLVTQGLRMGERRRFDFGARYFESIIALDPTFRDPYLLVDAVLTFSAVRATHDDLVDTRRILERGAAELPNDVGVQYNAGSFIAYVAPGYLEGAEQTEWEQSGTKYLLRAAALGTGNDAQALSLSGGSILNRLGQRDAAISFYQRVYAITDDPTVRADILSRLNALGADVEAERATAAAKRFEAIWRGDLAFVSRTSMLLIGPKIDPFACAGIGADQRPECRATFAARDAAPTDE